MSAYFGSDVPKLGFGMMRLPRKLAAIDIEETKEMVDLFMEAGFTYFDTAHIYPGSEVATRKALVERYPRERFTLATKLYAPMARNGRTARQQLDTSLEKLGTSYVDYYLLHSLNRSNSRKYEKLGLWDFVQEKKTEGAIRHVGFSFHDTPDVLEEISKRSSPATPKWNSCSCRSTTPTGRTPRWPRAATTRSPVPTARRSW